MPAALIPVVHVLAEDDDVGVADWLFVIEFGQEGIRRRATGATLGGKELDEHWNA